MKYWLTAVMLVLLTLPGIGHAGHNEEYEEAYNLAVMAAASVAAYSDSIGETTTRYLEENGWTIDKYTQAQNQSGARFLLAQKNISPENTIYVLAIVGTENKRDIKIDLKVDKVYFAGTTFEEFAANAALKDVAPSQPKIHRGFHEFIQAGPTARLSTAAGTSLSLMDILNGHHDNKLYLTGHSLGGAAAIIAGARFIDMGIDPAQLEVITFGSPAVGNAAFADKFAPLLNVTRVVIDGDPVTGALQTLVGGYKQFGREIKWKLSDSAQGFHNMTGYVDIALKNYYDKRKQVYQANSQLPHALLTETTPPVTQNRVYIASLQNNLQPGLVEDFPYMQAALLDEYSQAYPNSVTSEKTADANWQKQAAAANCRWVIVPQVISTQSPNQRTTYRITLQQTVYETATGAVVDMAAFSTSTGMLTPLEAFIHAFKGFRCKEDDWLRNSHNVNYNIITQ
ncbi:MAG: lipase class 3 [Firmicutes bacterium]|nr:lipase class 3 [Bacillota bacterium]